MRNILILGTARENSSRLKNKMTCPFGDSTLYDLYLKKLEELAEINKGKCKVAIAINRDDKILWNKTKNTSIEIIERDSNSISQKTRNRAEELHFLTNRKEDYIIWLNACFPLLSIIIIDNIINFFIANEKIRSLHCITKRHNWFWDKEKKPINNKNPEQTGTQYCDPLYESVHLLQIFNRENMLNKRTYWNFEDENDPYLYELNQGIELLDIDTKTDFDICKLIYERYQ